ncbi:MAG TPA: hypothetical protein VJZ00_15995 [Thermoanaerobaculia bacterium]|nr:hypothetical protein [Thermoanaerobaculia bacterium]
MGPKLFGGEALLPPKRLAVGFASFDDASALMAASGVVAGDGAFIGKGARITVSGASGTATDPGARRGVELVTLFSYFDGAERREAPFRAWACSRRTGCQGNAVSYTVPVDEVQRIRFTIGVETGSATPGAPTSRRRAVGGATESQALPVTLSLLSEPDSLKLARGYYVIVPIFENDSEPRWSAWTLGRVDGRLALVDSNGNAAPFEHFVVRIDYAS